MRHHHQVDSLYETPCESHRRFVLVDVHCLDGETAASSWILLDTLFAFFQLSGHVYNLKVAHKLVLNSFGVQLACYVFSRCVCSRLGGQYWSQLLCLIINYALKGWFPLVIMTHHVLFLFLLTCTCTLWLRFFEPAHTMNHIAGCNLIPMCPCFACILATAIATWTSKGLLSHLWVKS